MLHYPKLRIPIFQFFSDEFQNWVRMWIGDNFEVVFDEERGWYQYIVSVTNNNEEAYNLFFNLTEKFFLEFNETCL